MFSLKYTTEKKLHHPNETVGQSNSTQLSVTEPAVIHDTNSRGNDVIMDIDDGRAETCCAEDNSSFIRKTD